MGNTGNLIKRRKNFVRVNGTAFAHLIKCLQEECYSQQELAEKCGLSTQTIRLYMKAMHKIKAVHIADWNEDVRGGRTLKVFGLGDKPDAKKPKPKTSTESCRKYREKKKMMKILNALSKEIT